MFLVWYITITRKHINDTNDAKDENIFSIELLNEQRHIHATNNSEEKAGKQHHAPWKLDDITTVWQYFPWKILRRHPHTDQSRNQEK